MKGQFRKEWRKGFKNRESWAGVGRPWQQTKIVTWAAYSASHGIWGCDRSSWLSNSASCLSKRENGAWCNFRCPLHESGSSGLCRSQAAPNIDTQKGPNKRFPQTGLSIKNSGWVHTSRRIYATGGSKQVVGSGYHMCSLTLDPASAWCCTSTGPSTKACTTPATLQPGSSCGLYTGRSDSRNSLQTWGE